MNEEMYSVPIDNNLLRGSETLKIKSDSLRYISHVIVEDLQDNDVGIFVLKSVYPKSVFEKLYSIE